MKKFFSNLFKNTKGSIIDRNIMHPEREWFLGLSGALIFVVIGLFWSFGIYTHYSNVTVSTTSPVDETSVYKKGLVEAALSDLSERQRAYDLLQGRLIINKEVPIIENPVNETPVAQDGEELSIVAEPEDEVVILDEESIELAN